MSHKKRKRVYLAGPIVKGDLGDNITQAVDAMITLMKKGLAPFCPHLSCFSGGIVGYADGHYFAQAEVLPAGTKLKDWYGMSMAWVEVSEALLRLPGEGKGSDAEVERAKELGIPVFYSVRDVVKWAKNSAAAEV